MTVSLVTGGAGFIGSHLAQALLARGDTVRVLDNFSSGSRENLAGLDVEIVEGDMRQHEDVDAAVKGVDLIFHHAAYVSAPKSVVEPQECFDINVLGTMTLLEAARRAGAAWVVLASSAAVYGEPDRLPLSETDPTRPLSPYGVSKLVNEAYASYYTQACGLPVTALRYFNVYGPRQSPASDYAAAVPIFLRRLLDGRPALIYGDGSQTRDFVFIADLVRANLMMPGYPAAAGEVFNICGGQEISILDLASAMGRLLPDAPAIEYGPPRQGDILRSVGSPAKASAIGFQAETSLEDGLRITADWLRSRTGD
jgi:UDP-glucose 4-epimerase